MTSPLDLTAEQLMVSDFTVVSAQEPLSKVVARIPTFKSLEALVIDDGKYVGNISLNSISRSRSTFSTTFARNAVISSPQLSRDTPFLKIVEFMYYSQAHILPVVEENTVVGVVPVQKLLKHVSKIPELSALNVSDIADQTPITVDENESIARVIQLLRSHSIDKIPVISKGKLSGVIHLYMLLEKYGLRRTTDTKLYQSLPDTANTIWHAPEKVNILKSPISGEPLTECPTCVSTTLLPDVMNNFDVSKGLLITENNQVKGIVTARSFLRALMSLKVEPRNVRIVDFPDIDELDASKVNSLIARYYDKLAKILGPNAQLSIHFKMHAKQGARKKHSVHVKVQSPNFSFQADKVSWNLLTAVQQSFSVLEKEVLKKMKSFPSMRKNVKSDSRNNRRYRRK